MKRPRKSVVNERVGKKITHEDVMKSLEEYAMKSVLNIPLEKLTDELVEYLDTRSKTIGNFIEQHRTKDIDRIKKYVTVLPLQEQALGLNQVMVKLGRNLEYLVSVDGVKTHLPNLLVEEIEDAQKTAKYLESWDEE